MKRALLILLAATLPALSQSGLNFKLDHLASKAKEKVEITLDSNLLQLASNFLSSDKGDSADVKQLVSKLKGVYVRSFQFEKPGAYTPGDLDPVRTALKSPGWSRFINVEEEGEHTEVYAKSENGKAMGIAIVSMEPKELTVVYIDGAIDGSNLSTLGGKFGIPEIKTQPQQNKKAKD